MDEDKKREKVITFEAEYNELDQVLSLRKKSSFRKGKVTNSTTNSGYFHEVTRELLDQALNSIGYFLKKPAKKKKEEPKAVVEVSVPKVEKVFVDFKTLALGDIVEFEPNVESKPTQHNQLGYVVTDSFLKDGELVYKINLYGAYPADQIRLVERANLVSMKWALVFKLRNHT